MKRLLLLVLLATPVMAQAQSPQDLYQEALRLERSQGDLSGAIALYQRVAADYGGDRGLGALALLKIGQAYEQLGETEAERAYRRIVAEFGDQAETVAAAREALGRLVEPAAVEGWEGLSPEIAGQQIYAGRVSPDGGFFAASDQWGRLAYQGRGSSDPIIITEGPQPDPSGEWTDDNRPSFMDWTSAFSPDANQVAFARLEYATAHAGIMIHDRSTGQNRQLIDFNEHFGMSSWAVYGEVYDWGHDGQSILVGYEKRYRDTPGAEVDSTFLGVLDAETGVLKHSHFIPVQRAFGYETGCLINDTVALVNGEAEAGRSAVLRVDFVTGTMEPFWPERANSTVLACRDDGSVVAFRSDFFGEGNAYVVKAREGRPIGRPIRVPGATDRFGAFGLSNDGALHLYEKGSQQRLELYSISADARDVVGGATVLREDGGSRIIGWPRSGEYLGYFSYAWGMNLHDENGRSLRSVNLAELYDQRMNPIFDVWRIRFAADGSAVILARPAVQGSAGTWLFDPDQVALVDSLPNVFGSPGLSGRAISWADRLDPETMCVYQSAPPFHATEELVCYEDSYSVSAQAVLFSPDASKVSVATRSSGSPDWHLLEVKEMDVPGETHTTIVHLNSGEVLLHWEEPTERVNPNRVYPAYSWVPDGSGLIQHSKGAFHFLPLETGESEQLLERLTEGRTVYGSFAIGAVTNQILIHTEEDIPLEDLQPRIRIREGLLELLKD